MAERELLAIRLALGATQAELAKELGCHPSSIRRELTRNQVEGTYLPAQAQALADQRRRASRRPCAARQTVSRDIWTCRPFRRALMAQGAELRRAKATP